LCKKARLKKTVFWWWWWWVGTWKREDEI